MQFLNNYIQIFILILGILTFIATLIILKDQRLQRQLTEQQVEETIKKPNLELFLVDAEGNTTDRIHAEPTYITQIKKPKSEMPFALTLANMAANIGQIYGSVYGAEKEPNPSLVPIKIELSNFEGNAPAKEVRIFLKFSQGCELVEKSDAVGGRRMSIFSPAVSSPPPKVGLFISNNNELEAVAWINKIGNDLSTTFNEIYVRFPKTEEGQEYKIEALVTQHGYPSKTFEFFVTITPKHKEHIVYV